MLVRHSKSENHSMKTPQWILIVAGCVYAVVLVATAWFTRANLRRIAGALLGGIAVAIVGIGIERLAHTFGWWRYPWLDTSPIITPVRPAPSLNRW